MGSCLKLRARFTGGAFSVVEVHKIRGKGFSAGIFQCEPESNQGKHLILFSFFLFTVGST
jgi:hypothetical protein